jgi:hypothetical protein
MSNSVVWAVLMRHLYHADDLERTIATASGYIRQAGFTPMVVRRPEQVVLRARPPRREPVVEAP